MDTKILNARNVWAWFAVGIAFMLLGIHFVQAVDITAFNDGTTNGTFTYTTGTEQPTLQITIPNNATVLNAILSLRGYLNLINEGWDDANMNNWQNATAINGNVDNILCSTFGAGGCISGSTRLIRDRSYSTYQSTYTFIPTFQGVINVSFYLRVTGGAPSSTIRFGQSNSTGSYQAIRITTTSGSGFFRWTVLHPSQPDAYLCSREHNMDVYNYLTLIVNITNQTFQVYCNNTYNYTLSFSEGTTSLDKLSLNAADPSTIMYLDNLTVHALNYTGGTQYPTNVTIALNNQTDIFNYGAANASDLNHTVVANFTTYLASMTGNPQNFTFKSNTSGQLLYSSLLINYLFDDTPPTIRLNVSWNPMGSNGTASLTCTDKDSPTLLYNWTFNGVLIEKANYTNNTMLTNTSLYLQNLENTFNASCSDQTFSTFAQYSIMNNSLTVYYRDENNQSIVNENVSLQVNQNSTIENHYTTAGNLTIWKHNESRTNWLGLYEAAASSLSYSSRYAVFSFLGYENQTYTFYLGNQTGSVQFTIQDRLTKETVEAATVTMSRIIGTDWIVINGKLSDVTGKLVLPYTANVRYRFNVTKTGYNDKVFYLDPIIFATYTIEIDQSSQGYYAYDYDDVSVYINPTSFVNGVTNNLSVMISSASSSLNSYAYSVCYPGGCNSSTGSASSGETFTLPFNITNAGIWDRVHVNITYNTDFSGTRAFSYDYTITGQTGGRYTWVSNRTDHQGTGWLERILFGTFLLIIIVGVITLTAGSLAAGAVLVFMLGLLTYLKFFPVWAAFGCFIVGLLLLGKRSAE